ncbi:membrane protein [Marinosulfonomonas sp. PRT-SC04]|nr:membrane protein [Marinosulfonomonas sp. PRT-SC04]
MQDTHTPNQLKAIAFILLASVLIAGTSVLAKMLGHDTLGPALHPLQISHGRFLFAFIALLGAAAVLRPKFTKIHYGLHIARSSCGWTGISLMFAAIAYIPLADATAISFLNPVFAMMLAIPLLGEKVGPVRWAAAALALIGALVLLRPTPDNFQPASMLALGAAMVMGFEIILIKLLTRREAPLQILLVNNAIGLTIATVAVLFAWVMPTPAQWGALAALGGMMAMAQACFIQAMRNAESSFIAPFTYATLIFAGFYDYLIFDAVPDSVSVLGAGIIITGALLLAWREARRR